MANSLLKLTVESSEYDAKLKKAAEGIRHLADVAHKGDGDLTGLEKSTLDYIKSVGEMETKSRSAAGQVRELESTYKELKVVYDQLNEVEKADEGGKALAASLETLKQRAQDARKGLDDASKSLQENADAGKEDSSVLAQLASKFTVNIDALKLFDIGLQAAKAALDVAKDAFFASETNVDEWGRTLRSADGIYQSFLQSLNTSDFSSFLNNIGQVTQAARDAYNALDELGTRMTIINPERAKLQARQQELRADIRRNGADSEVGKAALQELKKIEPLLSKSFKTESKMNYDAFEKLVRERLTEGGINLNQKSFNDFMKTFSNDAAFQSLRKNARGSLTTEMTGNAYNPNAVMTRRTVDTRNTEQKLLDLFTDEWRKANSGYLTAAFNAQGAAASNMLGNSRYMKTTSGGGSGGGGGNTTTTTGIKDEFTDMEELVGLIPVAEQKVKDLQQQIRESWDEGKIATLRKELKAAQNELDVLQGKLPKDSVVELTITANDTDALQKVKEIDGVTIDPKTMTVTANDTDALQKVKEIDGVTIDPKTMTVTANTSEALQKVQELVADVDGKVVNVKVVPVLTDEDIDKQLQKQYGKAIQVPITSKLTTGEELVQSIRIKLADQNMNADIQTLRTLLETQIKNGIEGVDIPADWITDQIFGEGMDIPDETWQALQDQINEKLRELQIDPIKIDFKTGNIEKQTKQMTEDWKSAASAIQSVGSAMAQIEDPMTKVIGTIAQAVATMALSYAQAAASPAVTGSGWGWIAFAATGVSTMLSSIAAIKQATAGFYAEGGIVPGNNHNDGLLAHVSSGELILNRAQQNSIASQLEGGGLGNLQLETRVDAEELIIMLNNNGMRRGLGKFING